MYVILDSSLFWKDIWAAKNNVPYKGIGMVIMVLSFPYEYLENSAEIGASDMREFENVISFRWID